jgi:uncharacterized membrane protein
MSELSCAVVSDLLPLYVEGMLSSETQLAVAGHIDNCEACRAKYRQMAEGVPKSKAENKDKAMPLKRFYLHLTLIILGFPVWFPILAALFAVALSLYVAIWAVVIALWSIPLSLGATALAGIAGAIIAFVSGLPGVGVFTAGCAILCGGLAVLFFFPCLLLSKQVIRFTVFLIKKLARLITGRKG